MKIALKKLTYLILSNMMMTTLVLAEHTQARDATSLEEKRFEEVLTSMDQIATSNTNSINSSDSLLSAALNNAEIRDITYSEFKRRIVQGLQNSQYRQERIARRTLAPRGLSEGRREVRRQRRLERFASRLSGQTQRDISTNEAVTVLQDATNAERKATSLRILQSELAKFNNQMDFLNSIRENSTVLTAQTKDLKRNISRSIASVPVKEVVMATLAGIAGAGFSGLGIAGIAGAIGISIVGAAIILTFGIIIILLLILFYVALNSGWGTPH